MLGRRSDAHGSPVTDQDSCCSDDTVLSVGNEVENRLPDEGTAAAAAVSTLSFKNLEDHLNALSQGPSRLSPSNSSSRSCPSPPASFLFRAEHLVNFGYRGDNGGSSLCSPTSVRSDGADSPGSPGSRWAPAAVKSPNSPAESAFASSKHHHEPFGQQPEQGRPRAAPDAKSDNHQATLKFSIDNILKADFGRSRILDPIAIRKARPPPCKRAATSEGGFSGEQRSAPAAVGGESDRTGGPVDLSPGSDQGGGETKSESSKGDQPMLWPAWVYCTRYSDRPSSGGYCYYYISIWKKNLSIERSLTR
ncbi:hypothetical protein GWI33_006346 [Rhynchophorus ferrugineus]|uniref:Engrailed n=1 Tax=Rhynchophorus ferrugineus TaxID=354439 RepID=A0A834MHF4_RHYFE|nr:hypothetical protein GWI33_006346 [Rhynchophorus ferrugineus]